MLNHQNTGMNFLKSTLQDEIEKRKRDLESISGGKKYVKRQDIEKERERKYREEQAELEAKRLEKQQEKLRMIRETNAPEVQTKIVESEKIIESSVEYSIEEIVAFFRERELPITLFGENEEQKRERHKKHRKLEEKQKKSNNLDVLDTEKESEFIKKLAEAESKGKTAMETDPINPALVLTEPEKSKALITVFFQRLMKEWAAVLDRRPEEEKQSLQGRNEDNALKQTHEFLGPLFTLLRKPNSIKDDVAQSIGEMCYFMQHKDYVKANDAYMKLAIGNAPWPIGVVGVGIHERSASDRIGANQIARKEGD